MFLLKVAAFFLAAVAVGAEKKIELQDIEEDNLRSEFKSELEKDHDKSDAQQNKAPEMGLGFNSLDFMKTGLLRFFDHPQTQTLHPQQQQQRYVHQYAVTEPPERDSLAANKAQYETPPQQAMVGYLSNMPMQIYLVPQYYSTPAAQQTPHALAEFNPKNAAHGAGTANHYVEVPAYSPPTVLPPPTYLYQAQPTVTPALATVQPVISYQPVQVPVLNYNNYIPGVQVLPPTAPKSYYASPDYSETNTIDEDTNQSETPPTYRPSTEEESPRYYNSRAPIRGHHYKHHGIPELPHPNPLLLKAPPAHLSHIPRVLPMYRPYTKAYQENDPASSSLSHRPYQPYGPFKRRPTSLLDSYIPSSIQVEYLKRGLAKDPLSIYDALSSERLPHLAVPRHVERGFLPNQMYPTAAGGVTYGHYKRNPKIEKFPHK